MSDYNIMDRVCVNCGRRFGAHYGNDKINFCNKHAFHLYRSEGTIVFAELFLDSGTRKTKDGMELPTDKDPNVLFKRKKHHV